MYMKNFYLVAIFIAFFTSISLTSAQNLVWETPEPTGAGNATLAIYAESVYLNDVTVTTAWSGGATTLGLGGVGAATTLTAAGAIQGNAVGIVAASPGTDATRTSKWLNTGTGDHRLIVTTANTGNGVGAVTVVYAQSNNVT